MTPLTPSAIQAVIGSIKTIRARLRKWTLFGGALILAAPAAPVTFVDDVAPVLTKAGCNAGACHGAAIGQGGFRLSLLGYDPEADYLTITRGMQGRRVDTVVPSESLLLQKASRQTPHEGGKKLPKESDGFAVVERWIKQGAKLGDVNRQVVALKVEPKEILAAEGTKTPVIVRAVYPDGVERDVTELSLYSSNDDAVAEVLPDGVITIAGQGLTAVTVRFMGRVGAVRAGAPWGEPTAVTSQAESNHPVDKSISEALKQMGIPWSDPASGTEFLRRVTLDLTGLAPASERVRSFLSEPDTSARRMEYVDELLAGDEFVDLWTYKLADLLLISSKRMGEDGARELHAWLQDQIAEDRPLTSLFQEVLGAPEAGSSPAAYFQRLKNDPRDMGEFVAQTFLGARIACARCHNHPFDSWTTDDFLSFASYFASGPGAATDMMASRKVFDPKTGEPVAPRPLGAADWPSSKDSLNDLAAWMVNDNERFNQTLANRIWNELAGAGVVEPIDDLRPTNPPSNPALLAALVGGLEENDFKLRPFIRWIVASRAYQTSSQAKGANEHDTQLFSRAATRPLPPATLIDVISQVTGVSEAYEGYAAGTRAAELIDAEVASYTLDVLGRCDREDACDAAAASGGGLAQALHLMNTPGINHKVRSAVGDMLRSGVETDEAVEELYLRVFSRPPSSAEGEHWIFQAGQAGDRRAFFEDLFWAMLNSRAFLFNH